MEKILIIDDNNDICVLLEKFLGKQKYKTASAQRGEDGLSLLRKESYDLVICDFKLPDTDGLDMLRRIKVLSPATAVIIITGYSDVRIAVQALKYGAYDYVTKPLLPDEILYTIRGALEKRNVPTAKTTAQTQPSAIEPAKSATAPKSSRSRELAPSGKRFIFGKSRAAEQLQKHIELIAPTNMSVIITGETGTGKEFVANAIHLSSKRADKPFVAIDCGALSKELAGSELFGHVKGAFTGAMSDKIGSFEVANGGTLFLDEIGNLSYENQIKLLRVLQERKIKRVGGNTDISVDVRILCATNEDLRDAVRQGRFREDIYHRLDEFRIDLPALRERRADIMLFAEHFLEIANQQLEKDVLGFDDEARDKFRDYYWHGNLRELQNVVKRAVLLTQGDYITVDVLPHEIVSPTYITPEETVSYVVDSVRPGSPPVVQQAAQGSGNNLKSVSESAERVAILKVLEKTGYNKTKAAEVLNIDRKTLYNKLKAYDIHL
ncbi:two component, sigma54 specific, transcriptional regulator, Fis family [Fibrella aestuarina BUZ 2]|uniref:Two component, sigma54 specific, transcriptional regulator, Fis family n=1 Tax=Fibrella aestuarina BUZ 2 TaxID=1166018 RepID=I0K572_9BACT|nr:sigma-54 dependent transcriptional regulator [Fibrella aestuarina]CCG99275.1 two component, sigma54 specific, transcriptional regulator, Fis family [Fibrella aestuarina BUZ 2]